MTQVHTVTAFDTTTNERSQAILFSAKKLYPGSSGAPMSKFLEKHEPWSHDLARSQFRRQLSVREDVGYVANRSAIAYRQAGFLPDNDQTCPSPTVGLVQDDIDVHEALRSRIPPFRQSKRWTKAHTSRDMASTQGTAGTPITRASFSKNARGLSCDTTRSHNVHNSGNTGQSDTEPEQFRGCNPSTVLGWHALKQHRLIKRHSMPTRNITAASPRSPKRTKSTKSLRSGLLTSPRRALLPKIVQGKSSATHELRDHFDSSPKGHKHGPSSASARPSANVTSSADQQHPTVKHTDSPVPSLHDLEKVKRFSQDWVDKLSGLDFGDEWRLSVFGPTLSTPPETPTDLDRSKKGQQLLNSSPPSDTATAVRSPPRANGPPQPPLRTSSKRIRASGLVATRHTPKPARLMTPGGLRDTFSNPAHDADDEAEDQVSLLRHTIRRESSKTSMGQSHRAVLAKDLKSARSVDTLTKIEAQVVGTRTNSAVQRPSDVPDVTRAPPPKTLTPAGEPPERPLPDLPKADQHEAINTPMSAVADSAGRASESLADETEADEGVYKISAVHTLIAIPSYPNQTAATGMVRKEGTKTFDTSNFPQRSSFAERMADLRFANDQDSVSSPSDQTIDAFLKVKRMESKRSSKIQEIKRRHVAAWSKSQDGGSIRNASTDQLDSLCTDLGSNLHGLGLSSDPAPSPRTSLTPTLSQVEVDQLQTTKECSNEQEELFAFGDLDKFPPVPVTPPGSRSGHAADLKPSQSVNEKLSRADSKTRRHCAKQVLHDNGALQARSQEKTRKHRNPEQNLCRSEIMVVVDTNPHTSSFRAGAISPKSGTARSASQPTSPCLNSVRRVLRSRPSTPTTSVDGHAIKVDTITDLVDFVQPSGCVPARTKSSLRSIRSNLETVKGLDTDSEEKTLNCMTTMQTVSRPGSSRCYHHVVDSSSSEGEARPLMKQTPTASPPQQARASSSADMVMRRSHRRKDTPLTVMLKEEVKKADQELENLKKYEKRIEYLQMHLEETLKVWGKMRQNDKNQYLTSVPSERIAQADLRPEGTEASGEVTLGIDYSTRNTGSAMDKLKHDGCKSLDHVLVSMKEDAVEQRRISGSSTLTTNGTSTDTDVSVDVREGSRNRTSGGSLTDPQDYDIPGAPQRSSTGLRAQYRSGRSGAPTPCLRPVDASCPSGQTQCSQTSFIERPKPTVQSIMSQGQCMSPQDRAIVVPWEQQEQAGTDTNSGSDTGDDNDRLSVHHEIFSTDQMDALLTM